MEIKGAKKGYNVSRKGASRLLKVSMRTVDRYIKSKKLASRTINGRIWLDREGIEYFRGRQAVVDNVDMSTSKMSTGQRVDNVDTGVDKVDDIEVLSREFSDRLPNASAARINKRGEEATFKSLYEELRDELKEKQERLEIANYRVGQLEAQVKNSVPMLEYHHEKYQLRQNEESLQEKLNESATLIKKLTLTLRQNKLSKRIFLIILLIILALQPLWLLAHLKNLF